MRTTIYDEIGGEAAVTAVVDSLHERLLGDQELVRYFEGRNLDRLKAHQRALVSVALVAGRWSTAAG